jgi:hypothetical protein
MKPSQWGQISPSFLLWRSARRWERDQTIKPILSQNQELGR